jgi:hypothetical protein
MGLQTTGNGKTINKDKKPLNQKKVMALLSKKAMNFATEWVQLLSLVLYSKYTF